MSRRHSTSSFEDFQNTIYNFKQLAEDAIEKLEKKENPWFDPWLEVFGGQNWKSRSPIEKHTPTHTISEQIKIQLN